MIKKTQMLIYTWGIILSQLVAIWLIVIRVIRLYSIE